MRNFLIIILASFVCFCGWLVATSGLFTFGHTPCILLQQTTADTAQTPDAPAVEQAPKLQAAPAVTFGADDSPSRTVTLGSVDPKSGYQFLLELTSKGAAVEKATFSGFDDRNYKNPQPLRILSPIGDALSMANENFTFVNENLQLPLNKLHWKTFDVETAEDGSQTARFEAVIKIKDTNEPVVKLIKTYKVSVGSYHLACDITIENLSGSEQKVRFNLAGPLGINREGARTDMRKAVAGFKTSNGQIASVRLDAKKLSKAKTSKNKQLNEPGANFLWVAVTNKYFTAILVPLPTQGEDFCNWVSEKTGKFFNPDADLNADSDDENIGVDLQIATNTLAPLGQADSTRTYNFLLYLGSKDKSLFDKNQLYKNLGFAETIDFMACFCCPAAIIHPLAFGILAAMKWMHGFIPNYGVVIIILVFLVRLAMHPLTKKSQVSMSRYQKFLNEPEALEIKKKYAKNMLEMRKHLSVLEKERGVSQSAMIMGMLPMIVQMPIWYALYSAIYASIDLRGAPFLPFWITDLSAPDALVRFATVTIPFVGWKIDSLNLLPILMGLAFYLQQKLTPTQAAADPTNSQLAQQQKIMMFLMPLMFPLMLYKAPSGLNLYIMASTFAGVIEQYVIKKHIREKEQQQSAILVSATSKTGGRFKKKKPRPFFKNM